MKQTLILLFLAIPLFCMAQSGLTRVYEYDAAGNRTLCKVISVTLAPPIPTDTIEMEYAEQEYFVEKIAQMEIKIFPNPTTEKITLEISNWENLQRGNFQLYSLTGQLLQEHPVHSLTTTVSMATLSKGIYILKVNINNRIEEWKIIKN